MRRLLAAAFTLSTLGLCAASCSLGAGNGKVSSTHLRAKDCWDDVYEMVPEFFAANPYRNSLLLRVQRGNDIEEVSDGVTVEIDDVKKVRAVIDLARRMDGQLDAGSIQTNNGSNISACKPLGALEDSLGPHPNGTATFAVALPSGVTPPGSPAVPPPDLIADPPLVHMTMYLQRSCHNQNVVLHAVSGTITFASLFDGDPNEQSAAEKLIEVVSFNVQMGNLLDVPLGKYPRDIPCELQSSVHGYFRYYFDRGQPAQPFP